MNKGRLSPILTQLKGLPPEKENLTHFTLSVRLYLLYLYLPPTHYVNSIKLCTAYQHSPVLLYIDIDLNKAGNQMAESSSKCTRFSVVTIQRGQLYIAGR